VRAAAFLRGHDRQASLHRAMTDSRIPHQIWWTGGFFAAQVALTLLLGPTLPQRHYDAVWHPGAGLAAGYLIWRGAAGLPALAAAALAVPPLLGLPLREQPWLLALCLGPAASYAAIAWALRRRLREAALATGHGRMLAWVAVAALCGLAGAMLYTAAQVAYGLVPPWHWPVATLRYWAADCAGIVVVAPLMHGLLDANRRDAMREAVVNRETLAYVLAIVLTVGALLAWEAAGPQILYLLFLPLAWAGARQGMAGALAAALAIEIALTVAALLDGALAASMPDLQMLMLTLVLAGLLIGASVDNLRRTSTDLRRTLRLAAAGEMAGALAHELNQPLAAISAYGSACERLLAQDEPDRVLLGRTVHALAAESRRASDVLTRLRDFFRTGSTRLQALELAEVVSAACARFADPARAAGIDFQVADVPPARLLADRVQLEVVLRNLLANAFDAVAGAPAPRRVSVRCEVGADTVRIRVEDNGPGIDSRIRPRVFEPFVSQKSSGMGLGLAISRSIVDAHGGRLSAAAGRHGILEVTLPRESEP